MTIIVHPMSLKSVDAPTQSASKPNPPLAAKPGPSLAADLAVEIFFQIFSLLRAPPPPLHSESYYWTDEIETFFRQRHEFAQLSLVCRSWSQVITSLLYKEVFVSVSTIEGLRRSALAFDNDNNAALIRSVLICTTWKVSDEHRSTMIACLKKCPNIQKIECFTRDLLFTSRTWIHALPSLVSSVKTLTLCDNHRYFNVTLSRALMALGRNLQRLVIHRWQLTSDNSNFHLPCTMPHLSELEFWGEFRPGPLVTKLFSRIVSKKGGKDTSSPLRKLSFQETSFDEGILTFVRWKDRIGPYLQALHIGVRRGRGVSTRLVVQIVRLCPELVDFSYSGLLEKDVLASLPKTLRSLRIRAGRVGKLGDLPPSTMFPSNRDICGFLESRNTLLEFGIFLKFVGFDKERLVQDTCKKKGIVLLPSIRLLNTYPE